MSGDNKAQFSAWYEYVKDKSFKNREEVLAYFIDNLNVRRQACCASLILFLKLVKMDPFRQANKIWSICNKVFQTMYLKPDSVGIIPRRNYRMEDRQSLLLLNVWRTLVGHVTMLRR